MSTHIFLEKRIISQICEFQFQNRRLNCETLDEKMKKIDQKIKTFNRKIKKLEQTMTIFDNKMKNKISNDQILLIFKLKFVENNIMKMLEIINTCFQKFDEQFYLTQKNRENDNFNANARHENRAIIVHNEIFDKLQILIKFVKIWRFDYIIDEMSRWAFHRSMLKNLNQIYRLKQKANFFFRNEIKIVDELEL